MYSGAHNEISDVFLMMIKQVEQKHTIKYGIPFLSITLVSRYLNWMVDGYVQCALYAHVITRISQGTIYKETNMIV